MERPGAARLYEMLARNHELAGAIEQRGFPLQAFEHLQKWQQARLARTFEDLLRDDSYHAAVNFFLTELYGGLDFRNRDQDMSKVMPVMKRFLPDKVLFIMSEAFELQAISIGFDMKMAGHMEQAGVVRLDIQGYCETYRSCNDRQGRERQLLLIRKLGYDLDKLVHKPLVNVLVRLLRGPAHAAGFGKLQEFLEAGLGSFRMIKDVSYFNETVYQRESGALEKLFAGDDQPFGFRSVTPVQN
jgi:hypothetical protein